MRQKSVHPETPSAADREEHSPGHPEALWSEEKIRIVLDGLRGKEDRGVCRREGIAESLYYNWSKEFLEAGKKRLAGDTARAATRDEVKELRVKRGSSKRSWLNRR